MENEQVVEQTVEELVEQKQEEVEACSCDCSSGTCNCDETCPKKKLQERVKKIFDEYKTSYTALTVYDNDLVVESGLSILQHQPIIFVKAPDHPVKKEEALEKSEVFIGEYICLAFLSEDLQKKVREEIESLASLVRKRIEEEK